jgi:hypothetical protein
MCPLSGLVEALPKMEPEHDSADEYSSGNRFCLSIHEIQRGRGVYVTMDEQATDGTIIPPKLVANGEELIPTDNTGKASSTVLLA